jgi:hypothetical protein
LKGGAPSVMGDRGRRARSVLVFVQVALALILLMGSGLLLRSLQCVLSVNWGFRPDRLLTMQMMLPESRYDTAAKQGAFVEALLERVGGLPAVESAATSNALPLMGYNGSGGVRFEGQPAPPPNQQPTVPILRVTSAYFGTMGTVLLAGRQFNAADTPGAEPVAIVNATFAKRFYPGGDAVGKRIQWGATQQYTMISGDRVAHRTRRRQYRNRGNDSAAEFVALDRLSHNRSGHRGIRNPTASHVLGPRTQPSGPDHVP